MTALRPSRSLYPRVALVGLAGLLACRAVLGIDEPAVLPDDGDADASDAAADRGVADAGTDARRFCDDVIPRPTFCTDFDRGELLSEWTPTTLSGTNPHLLAGGAVDPDLVQFRSGPRAVRFSSPAQSGAGPTATAFAAVDLPRVPQYLFVELDLRIDTELFVPDAGGRVDLLEIELPGAGAIRIARNAGGTLLAVADYALGTEATAPFSVRVPVGDWVSLKLVFHNDTGSLPGDVGVYLGSPAAKLETPNGFQRKLGKAPILRAGIIAATSPVGVFRTNIDNLRLSYEP